MSGPICVTLKAINVGQMQEGRGARLLAYLGKTCSDDEPLPLVTILDSNGMEDALWALRAVKGEDARIRRFAVWCARQVQHLMTDSRSVDALTVAERYADGLATDDELQAAGLAAWKVPDISAWTAAGAAARVAVAAAQWDAAWAAAGTASWKAVVAAMRDARSGGNAAGDAAEEAAWTAARAAQAREFRRAFGGDA